MYKVIKAFQDIYDGHFQYNIGDEFPRKGRTADEKRLAELSGSENLQGTPLIKKEAETKKPKKGMFNKRDDIL